ncbi:Adenosine kinase [Polaromonas vacuolata]|uniref:Adenosine kinase n=1 Tax=Polaromonas vacuolata TaxID=37448 RepID=A0A6H2HD01_9BURK|nr:carbohydrate kinase family protein [Polaromonas vacuolata]QJC57464.1 Adenosine kinase [Polaromonas vacuolata]
MSALICGSLAFDTIMTFEGRFSEQILPDQLHILNVSFLVPALRREFGGCAGNIAYCLQQLGGTPLPLASIGSDGAGYAARMRGQGISTEFIHEVPDSYTAQAMIMTDRDNNQITAFHPGAMSHAHLNPVPQHSDIKIGIVSPDGREAMQTHAAQFSQAKIPFLFDPGQGLPMFDGADLKAFVAMADWITVNDYEGKLLCDRTALSCEQLSRQVKGLIVTLGADGCDVWVDGEKTHVPPVLATEVLDPTGCGDAFRGALLFGLERGWSLVRCAELGNRVGSHKIAHYGCQNYTLEAIVASL